MSDENIKAGERERAKQRRLANYAHLGDVLFELSLELGRKEISLRDAAQLRSGDIIELDKLAGEAKKGKNIARSFELPGEREAMSQWLLHG